MLPKRTVLVVDDQQVNRLILGKILGEEYQVMYAANGLDALKQLHAHADAISAVLLDIIMPEMDGYTVLHRMREDAKLSKIPAIVSSQKGGEEDEVKALALGAQDFIAKPYKADIIRHRLANTIKLRETAATVNALERDELTGLYNKQKFYSMVEKVICRAEPRQYDMICLDVERFKLINDTYGMTMGDRLLCHIATLLKESVPQKHIYGHFGADVFYVLLPHIENYTDEMFRTLTDKLNEFPVSLQVRMRYGIYTIDTPATPVNMMCDRAKLAADSIKGRYDRLFAIYDDRIRQRLLDEQFITNCFETALRENQFQIYYQPKYNLVNECIAGAEALVRWHHPVKGFLSPGLFIPLLEKSGFITQLDHYVWKTVCRDLHDWIAGGHEPVAVSVNVSRADIYDANLKDILIGLVEEYQIPIKYLHLEITETAYTENPSQILKTVSELRKMGFLIELDDFGSGYSSVNMLADMPVDVLKLDMRFIQVENDKANGRAIISFVISLAKWLDLAVVAEGAETKEQVDSLRSMDCNYVQGYYFAKPMPKDKFEALLLHAHTTDMICTSMVPVPFKQEQHPAHQDRVVLVVDDIQANRKVLAGFFQKEYTIQEAENGRVAWEYLFANYEKVEVVLLDLLMPELDGFQMLSKIRSEPRTKNVPVIITSQGNENSERRALVMGADDFISKPYNAEIVQHRTWNVIAKYKLKNMEEVYRFSTRARKVGKDVQKAENSNIQEELNRLNPYFDIVRLVDPVATKIVDGCGAEGCENHGCYRVWGKNERCNNCISLRALQQKTSLNKLEYNSSGIYFVISKYVNDNGHDAVIEMVTKLDDSYVDNVFDRDLLYLKLESLNRELEIDELTGLKNRRHIDRYLDHYLLQAQKGERSLCAAMADLDGLKSVNDNYGHLLGDTVIKKVAELLKAKIPLGDGDFIARYGGDEFFILRRNVNPQEFNSELRAAVEAITEARVKADENIKFSISIGSVALREIPGCTSEELIHKADERMYIAKRQGRGRLVVEDEFTES